MSIMHRYESVYTRSLDRWLLLQNYALCLPMERLHCILLRVNLSGVVPAYIRYNNIQNKKPYMKIIGRTYNMFYKICISRTVCTSGITTDNVHMLAQCILYTRITTRQYLLFYAVNNFMFLFNFILRVYREKCAPPAYKTPFLKCTCKMQQ